MLDKETIESELKKQLALDFNCNADDFTKNESIIVVPKEHPGRREYTPKKAFFSMATMGRSTVINAPEEMHAWLSGWVNGREGIWLFEDRTISLLTYNIETLLAEKIQTILVRGIANTRMRDFYDVHGIGKVNAEQIDAEVLATFSCISGEFK